MIEIACSKSGELTAKIDSHYLHSSYSPIKESEKLFHRENLKKYSTFILLEPCLNYISLILKQNNPDCKILSIYLHREFYDHDENISDSKFLFNRNTDNLKKFLRMNLSELDIEGLKIFEWNPSYTYFKDSINLLKTVASQQVRELYGNVTTISGFGKTQFRNFLKNYISVKKSGIPLRTNLTAFIAGSGPSLENDIDFLKKNRNRLLVIGLPSSLHYLKHFGLSPDFIISTDPGYYAGSHLTGFNNIPIIAPYTAKLPSTSYDSVIIPVQQEYFPEKYIFSDSDSYIKLPSNGTVAGSAVFFSHLITTSKILISGLDFSFIDILSHIRPHTFDSLIEIGSGRKAPTDTKYFERNIPQSQRVNATRRTSKALRTYKGWFASNSSYLSNRCYFLNYHTTPPGSFKSINHFEAENLLTADSTVNIKFSTNDDQTLRINNIKHYLHDSINNLYKSIEICRRTYSGPLLFEQLNNEIIFNLFLPELLQFKRQNLHIHTKESQNRAVSIIEKTISFLEGFFYYV